MKYRLHFRVPFIISAVNMQTITDKTTRHPGIAPGKGSGPHKGPPPKFKARWKRVKNRSSPLVVKPFPGLWPDGTLRWYDPATVRCTEHEMLLILEMLIALNHTGLYTAFFQYHAHTGSLVIDLYEGRWGMFKEPFRKIDIDCRRFPLVDSVTEKPFYARPFLEELILLVQ